MGAANGFPLSIEPYDMNPAADSIWRGGGCPMGEFWSDGFGFNSAFSVIEARRSATCSAGPSSRPRPSPR